MNKENYAYAVARIRVLETKLLNKQVLNHMAESRNTEEALKILQDAGYGNNSEVINVREYEKLLIEELHKTYDTERKLVPNEKFFDIFLCRHDYHNIKVLLKEEFTGVSGAAYLVDSGTVDLKTLKNCLLERKFFALPPVMSVAIVQTLDIYTRTQNGQLIDLILDKAAYEHMGLIAREGGNKFLIQLVQVMCDLSNLRTFLRVRKMGRDHEFFMTAVLPGGTIPISLFMEASKLDNPSSAFTHTDYSKVCQEGFDKSFVELEKICDNFLIEYVKQSKYKHFTVEPLIAYLFAKELEIRIVRIILTSKVNKIDAEIIKERLRESYVV